MQKISSIEVLAASIEKFTSRGTVTNNFLMLGAFEQYINNGRLFCSETESNFYILHDKIEFFQLFYHINDFNELFHIAVNKPITMEILYRGDSHKPRDIFSYWESCGFENHISRDILIARYNQIKLPEINNYDITIKYADTDKESVFTKRLIENTFDKFTGDILSLEEVDEFVVKKNVLCAYWKGHLCGILQFEIKNSVVWIGHIAVSPDFKGNGIAKELVKAYIINNKLSPNTRYQLWVIHDNKIAQNLYQKFGFLYGNKSSASMLKF